jgi:CheY-like chemotaxis protein
MASTAKKGLTLRYSVECAQNNFIGDANKIRQILSNLVSNAIKFTDKGVIEVNVDLQNNPRDKRKWIRFKIRDTGPGVPIERQHLLFQNFSQVEGSNDRKFGGTGLGLSISKMLSQLMGGNIQFDSDYKQGAQFILDLPLIEALSVKESKEAKEELDNNVSANPLILVVDDHPTNRKIIEVLFKKNNMNFIMADSGAMALNIIQEKKPQLVFMDIQMPEMDGLETTRKLRSLNNKEFAKIPIIAMTANALKGDRERFIDCGMNDYISKPFTENDLLAIYEKWVKSSVLNK